LRISKACFWTALGAALLAMAARGDAPPGAEKTGLAPLPPMVVRAPISGLTSLPSEVRAAIVVAEANEPTLQEAQSAAARLAAGSASEDASRVSRARGAHWAPVVRGQLGGNASDHTRDGTMYDEPLHWTDVGGATTWGVTLTWDLPSAIYARDENQLALSQVHLARMRREVSARAGQLYGARQRQLLTLRSQTNASASAQLESALALLETTAELDAITGGLFAPALARAQSRVDALTRSLHLEDLP